MLTRSEPLAPLVAVGVALTVLSACHRAAPPGARTARAARRAEPACPPDLQGSLEGAEPPPEDTPVPAPRKLAWERAHGGREAALPHVRARLRGWPARLVAERATLPGDDRAFLERLARDTWRGLDALADRETGLPVDHLSLGDDAAVEMGWRIGDYANVSTIGLYLADVVAAHELGLVAPAEARARLERLLDTIERLETHGGLLFNYYDAISAERTSNFLSFLDSAWLAAGLMVVRSTFPDLAARCTPLIDRMDYGFFLDRRRGLMRHGYDVRRRRYSRYHYGVFYTEARLAVLIAIGKGDVPEDVWFRMVRTYPPACRGQPLVPRESRWKRVLGHDLFAGHYEWRGLAFVPSWGGSMFEALMPALVVDEARWAGPSLGANDRAHAEVQRRWAVEELGYPVWGLSPSTPPWGEGYQEYGVRVLGTRGYPSGAVTPHAAALALLATPEAATADLRRLAARYDLYGDFGLYDAVDPSSGRVARTYLTLDQSMVLLAVANHLKDGCIQKRFAADPLARRALPLIGAERFFD